MVNNLQKYIIYSLLFLYPIFFLPIFASAFDTAKLFILLFLSLLVLLLKLIEFTINKGGILSFSREDFVVFLAIVAYLLSGLFVSANRMDAFFIPGTSLFVIFSAILYFLINQLDKKEKEQSINLLIISALVLALSQIATFSGLTNLIPQLSSYIRDGVFTPFGNLLNSTLFILCILPFSIHRILNVNNIRSKVFNISVSFFLIISIFISIYLMLPGKPTAFRPLDIKSSWSIAVDTLKQNVFGVGAGNYTQAFLKSKPIELNLKDNWDSNYQQGFSTIFTIFTELGMAGLVLFVFTFIVFLKKSNFTNPSYIALAIVSLATLLVPYTHVFFPIVFYLYSINSEVDKKRIEFKQIKFITIPTLVLVTYIFYLFGSVFYADFLFFKAVSAAYNNDGKSTYHTLNKAVSANPRIDNYHLVLAQVNLNLAQSISQKEGLSDEDKQNIATLIQQAVNEGKAAVKVNPNKSANWEGLSDIYQAIIPYAKGSENFAVESLNQAIFLSPLNPKLRLKLGGIYYNFGKYDEAIDVFKLAVLTKNDLANARYNLAAAYKEGKQIDKAIVEMEKVVSLVDKDSPDYQKATEELSALRNKKTELNTTSNTENLSLPQQPEELSPEIPAVEIGQ